MNPTRPLVHALLWVGISLAHAAEEPRFPIRGYQVEGNSLLPQAQIEQTVAAHTCASCSFETIEQALKALQSLYREAGYGAVLVTVPEQELSGGVVRLRVIEPKLGPVELSYDPPDSRAGFDEANIRASLPDLKEGRIIDTPALSRNIQLANENPAKRVEVVLRTGDDPALLRSGVKVAAQPPRSVFLTLDNTGTDQTGEYRLGLGLRHANLFGLDHVATFGYVTPVDRATDTNLYSGSYRIPLYRLGDSIDLIASKSDVSAATTTTVAGPLQFAGSGELYGVRYNRLLPRWGEYSQRLVLGWDYWQISNQCSLGIYGAEGCGPAAADVGLMPVTLTYGGQWSQARQTVDLSLAFSHNIPGAVNHGAERDFHAARPANIGTGGASADFYLLRGAVAWTHAFESDWQVRFAANGQFSTDALLYVQQFGLSGATAVRGFYEREVTRDIGFALNAELYTPNYAPRLGYGESLRGSVFVDYGAGRNNRLAGETRDGIDISSVGLGLQFGLRNSLQLRFHGAYVIDGATIHNDGDARAHLAVYLPFGF